LYEFPAPLVCEECKVFAESAIVVRSFCLPGKSTQIVPETSYSKKEHHTADEVAHPPIILSGGKEAKIGESANICYTPSFLAAMQPVSVTVCGWITTAQCRCTDHFRSSLAASVRVFFGTMQENKDEMTKKIFGVLERNNVLLEPVNETRYHLAGDIDADLVGQWMTIQGQVDGSHIADAVVANVEKNSGKVTRAGLLVDQAPALPPEANGQGAYLYQQSKGRYLLVSDGPVNSPVSGDFRAFVGQEVKVAGEFGAVNYVLYNAKVSAK
jgi:hypothetical protein